MPQSYSKKQIFAVINSYNLFRMYFRYLTFLFFILIGSGCCEQEDLKLQPSLTAWMPYESPQKLIFRNETGDSLTFLSSVRHYNQQASDKVCGTYNIETRETILKLETDTTFQVQVVLSHEAVLNIKAYNKEIPGKNLFIQFNGVSEQFISDPWRDRYEKDQDINGRIYPQVLHVYGEQIGGVLSFADLLYARNEGLIGFKALNGAWYFLP